MPCAFEDHCSCLLKQPVFDFLFLMPPRQRLPAVFTVLRIGILKHLTAGPAALEQLHAADAAEFIILQGIAEIFTARTQTVALIL